MGATTGIGGRTGSNPRLLCRPVLSVDFPPMIFRKKKELDPWESNIKGLWTLGIHARLTMIWPPLGNAFFKLDCLWYDLKCKVKRKGQCWNGRQSGS